MLGGQTFVPIGGQNHYQTLICIESSVIIYVVFHFKGGQVLVDTKISITLKLSLPLYCVSWWYQ
jgi:hypothetical protein